MPNLSNPIVFLTGETVIGIILIASSTSGICHLRLGNCHELLQRDYLIQFPTAQFTPEHTQLIAHLEGIKHSLKHGRPFPIFPLDLQGTLFQKNVWQSLVSIPFGQTRSYQEIALKIKKPKAYRAVALACSANPIALLIPCHRVIRQNGSLSGYRWGADCKWRLLQWEQQSAHDSTQNSLFDNSNIKKVMTPSSNPL